MTDNEKKVLRYIDQNPRAELQQICVGTELPVALASPAIDSLVSSGLIEMFYGTGGHGTQYIVSAGDQPWH